MTRIVLVHPYVGSIAPIEAAFRTGWPEAEVLNLLDETLYADVEREALLREDIFLRVESLLRHAQASGAAAIVFTGSTFGPAVDAGRKGLRIPALKADEAMCMEAVERGSRIAIVCTAARALPVIADNLTQLAPSKPTLAQIAVEGAKFALEAGDRERHDALIAETVRGLTDFDAILLGQMSMATARRLLPPAFAAKTISSPEATVKRLRTIAANSSGA